MFIELLGRIYNTKHIAYIYYDEIDDVDDECKHRLFAVLDHGVKVELDRFSDVALCQSYYDSVSKRLDAVQLND